jgi:hypothetical protein
LYLFLCQYHSVFISMALKYSLKSGTDSSSIALFSQYCLGYSRSFVKSSELQGWILSLWGMPLEWWWGCIEHIDCFGSKAIFMILIPSIDEYGRSFHLLMSSLISFFSDL